MKKIILASKSPRRSQLLEWAEINFEIVVADTDESFPAGLSPPEAAIHIARNKAVAVQKMLSKDPVRSLMPILAADTIVVLGKQIIGKPVDREDGVRILTKLSGKTHEV